MTIWQSQSGRLWIKRLAATALAIWLSGANCLWCCGPMETASVEAENCAAAMPANSLDCAFSGKDDCCQKESDASQPVQHDPCQDECCILNAPTSELPSGIKLNQFSAIAAPVLMLREFEDSTKADRLPFTKPRLLNGQQTHLRCCVFLI